MDELLEFFEESFLSLQRGDVGYSMIYANQGYSDDELLWYEEQEKHDKFNYFENLSKQIEE